AFREAWAEMRFSPVRHDAVPTAHVPLLSLQSSLLVRDGRWTGKHNAWRRCAMREGGGDERARTFWSACGDDHRPRAGLAGAAAGGGRALHGRLCGGRDHTDPYERLHPRPLWGEPRGLRELVSLVR